ncbi:LacI family DNA-binding transcriptional regulator [Microbacteriaceae bacterium VKM Ac-2855]|nr:LacI family DNA-binding transcriptional regulator [Microbacteriaceae bacterium VKM Ac-2855]
MSTPSSSPRPARPTLAKVAARAGVSASTASLVFSGSGPVAEATRERVLAAAEELDYAGPDPRAQSLRRGRSGIVGVVLDERVLFAFRDPIKIAMLDGLADVLGSIGAGILLLTDTGDAPLLETAPVDAMVLVGCSPKLYASMELLQRRGIPVVVIEGLAHGDVPVITLDNRPATAEIATHLRDLGHRRVQVVTLPFDVGRSRGPIPDEWEESGTVTTVERFRGARDVFPDASGIVAGASYVEEGVIAGRALLAVDPAQRPTAIIAQSDLLAAGVILAAEELGLRVPHDVSVVGFDGVRVPGLSADYDLTTMAQPAVEKGRAGGQAVVDLLAGRAAAAVGFESTFHLGNTTAVPRDLV